MPLILYTFGHGFVQALVLVGHHRRRLRYLGICVLIGALTATLFECLRAAGLPFLVIKQAMAFTAAVVAYACTSRRLAASCASAAVVSFCIPAAHTWIVGLPVSEIARIPIYLAWQLPVFYLGYLPLHLSDRSRRATTATRRTPCAP